MELEFIILLIFYFETNFLALSLENLQSISELNDLNTVYKVTDRIFAFTKTNKMEYIIFDMIRQVVGSKNIKLKVR